MTYETSNNHIIKQWRYPKRSKNMVFTKNFALVEKMFYLRKKIQEEVSLLRAEQGFYQSGHKDNGGGSHSFISDPTSQIALKRIQPIKCIVIAQKGFQEEKVMFPEKWLYIIEKTLNTYPEDTLVGKVIRARYLNNDSQPKTCIELGFEPKDYYKYYNARNEGIQFAKECAIQMGIIKVF